MNIHLVQNSLNATFSQSPKSHYASTRCKFRFYTSKMNEICLHCHMLYFSSIILSFWQCALSIQSFIILRLSCMLLRSLSFSLLHGVLYIVFHVSRNFPYFPVISRSLQQSWIKRKSEIATYWFQKGGKIHELRGLVILQVCAVQGWKIAEK